MGVKQVLQGDELHMRDQDRHFSRMNRMDRMNRMNRMDRMNRMKVMNRMDRNRINRLNRLNRDAFDMGPHCLSASSHLYPLFFFFGRLRPEGLMGLWRSAPLPYAH